MGIALQVGGVPHSHSHGGGHFEHDSHDSHDSHNDHDIEHKTVVRKRNINVRAAFIHVLGDFFQSVGVLVAALVIYIEPEYSIVDPLCTFLFSVLVLITTFNIIRDVLNVLMEGMLRLKLDEFVVNPNCRPIDSL
jgi:cation diffusion facilitator family transporter